MTHMCLFMLLMLNMSLYIYEICLSTIGFYCSIHTRMDMRKSLKQTKSFFPIHMLSILLLSFFVGRHQHIKVEKEEQGGGFIQQLSLKSFTLEERIYEFISIQYNATPPTIFIAIWKTTTTKRPKKTFSWLFLTTRKTTIID